MAVFGQKWLSIGIKWLYLDKYGCIEVVVFRNGVAFGQKWLYLDKVVAFGKR